MRMIAALLHLLTTPRPRSHAVALAGVTDDELMAVAHAARVVRHPAGTFLVLPATAAAGAVACPATCVSPGPAAPRTVASSWPCATSAWSAAPSPAR